MALATSTRRIDGGRIRGAFTVPSVIEIVMMFTLVNLKSASIRFHGAFVTAPANMQTLANALSVSLGTAWSTNLAPLCPPGTTYNGITARDMTLTTNPVAFAPVTPVPGTAAAPALPLPVNVAAVMTQNISSRGRGLKGRVYLPGFASNADAGNGQMTTATGTAINSFGTAVTAALTAQSLTATVAQPARQAYIGVTGTAHGPRSVGHTNVTSMVARDLIWDTQRRRVQP